MSGQQGLRLLVCGGRNYADRDNVFAALDLVKQKRGVTLVIHGDAPGADTLAREWAVSRGIQHEPWPADWAKLGRSAGPARNQTMLDQGRPNAAVAFPGGRGTDDMVRRARAAGVPVWIVGR